jgi:regulator of sigma E protease
LVAKKNGIRVEEFGLGMPPRIFGKKFGETEYTINWLPFGGFVKLTGEEIEDEEDEPKLTSDPRSFASKTPFQRISVLVAGVIMNFLLAVSLYYMIFFVTGFKTFTLPMLFDFNFKFGNQHTISTVITDISDDSAAMGSGIELGEAILTIDGVRVFNVDDVRRELKGKVDQEVLVELEDLKKPIKQPVRGLKVYPKSDDEGNAILGVYLGDAAYITYDGPFQKMFSGFLHSYNVMDYSLYAMGNIFKISFESKDISPVSQSVAGPVGIYNLVGSILQYGEENVALSLMDYVALMSLSLAFINIMPFPALDGGRVIFILVEKIRGKRVDPVLEGKIHRVGITLLFGLLILVTIKDLNLKDFFSRYF